MVFGQLCAPALIYIVFSITQITMDSLKGLYNVAFVKLFISLLFTILLNHLCQRGLGIISWIIVFIPFMLMSLITALLLALFGMDAATGKLKLQQDEPVVEEKDVREKAIADYAMNRSKEDYIKRLEEMGYNMNYLDLKGKAGQSVINPAYNDLYHTSKSNSEYELVKSGSARNRLKSRTLAEELYYMLESKVSSNQIKLEQDENGIIKGAFLENCDYMINVLYEDLHYRLDKSYKVFDLEEEKQEEGILNALKEMNNWGVLRNINGNVTSNNDFDVHKIRNYTNNLNETHTTELLSKWKQRIQTKFETKCNKLQVKLDEFAQKENIDFSKYFSTEGESEINDLLDRAYSSNILNDGFVAPTRCTPEMREMCKVQKRGQCRPCDEREIIEGTNGDDTFVACPHLCDSLGSNKLCQYCSLCSGDEVNGKMPPPGKSWIKYTDLQYNESAPTSYPTKFEDATKTDWWKTHTVIKDENATPDLLVDGSTSVRSCAGDSRYVMDEDGNLNVREGQETYEDTAKTHGRAASGDSGTSGNTNNIEWEEKDTALYAGTENINFNYSQHSKTGYQGCKSECADQNSCLGFEWKNFGEDRCAKIIKWENESNKFRLTQDGEPEPDFVGKYKSSVKKN